MSARLWYAGGMDTMLRPRRDFAALEARRMKVAQLFAQSHPQAEIVRRLKVSRPSAHRWYQAWRRHGRSGLKGAGRAGRKPRLDARARRQLEAALLRGPAAWGYSTHLWTLERVARVIWKTCHVRYHPRHVWRVLRGLGWSRQRPARRAQERNEAAIAHWVRVRWPQVKKTPKG
jgi:transposase